MVELKDDDDDFSLYRKRSSSVSFQSPGYPFHTPSNNPYNFFMSPSTPISTMEGNINSLVPMQNSTLDEFKNLIQQEIESNLKGENKKTSTTTIGASPGSAFSYCFQWLIYFFILFYFLLTHTTKIHNIKTTIFRMSQALKTQQELLLADQ